MKTALIIINYGTPNTASRSDVASFLRDLLDDNHVMTMNAVGRKILVNCIIAPLRSRKSSKLYQRLADISGGEMPLKKYTREFADNVQKSLGVRADVYVAMTAGYNRVRDVMGMVLDDNYSKIVVAPMFPQYTESTWGKVLDDVFSALKGRLNVPPVVCMEPFWNDDDFLDTICGHISEYLPSDVERIVFSYHGVPIMHTELAHPGHTCGELGCADAVGIHNQKCYLAQCHAQTRLIGTRLNMPAERCLTTFQSRFADKWVSPFTDAVVRQLAADGIKNIAVVTPSFTVDCLETIIEIDESLREIFIKSGGEKMTVVPCLNASERWIKNFCKIVSKSL
ncbi:MAG: ferrochelatase [Bacteroidales bacterium]|nr:ferrochelatase [Bacteroidales bacterium]